MAARTAMKEADRAAQKHAAACAAEKSRLIKRAREELRRQRREVARKAAAAEAARRRKERALLKPKGESATKGRSKSNRTSSAPKGAAQNSSRSEDEGDDLVVPPDIDSDAETGTGTPSSKSMTPQAVAQRAARRAARLRSLPVPRLPTLIDEEHLMLVAVGELPSDPEVLGQVQDNFALDDRRKAKKSTSGKSGKTAKAGSGTPSAVDGAAGGDRKRRPPPTLWELLTPMQARALLPPASAAPPTRELLPAVPSQHRGTVVSCWIQLCRLAPLLRVSPIGMDALASALLAPDSESALLADVFSRGTRALLGLPLDRGQAFRAAAA